MRNEKWEMKIALKKYRTLLIGGVLGAIAGYAYYYFVGCANGTCAITSNPVNSTLYGILTGGIIGDIFRTNTDKK